MIERVDGVPGRQFRPAVETTVRRGLRAPMRDGVLLATDVVRPQGPGRHPAILLRTPYDKARTLVSPAMQALAGQGYAVVVQDCRGRFNSGGQFDPYVDETDDGHDTVQWLAEQDFCNGVVGMTGGSYVGQTCWYAAAQAPAALRAMVPVVSPPGDPWRNEPLWGGTFLMAMAAWMQSMGERSFEVASPADSLHIDHDFLYTLPLEDVPAAAATASAWWDGWMDRPLWDEHWHRAGYEHAWPDITAPALNITGWYDMNFIGSPRNFVGMRQHGPTAQSRDGQRLLIGPWHHHVNRQREMNGVDFGPQAITDVDGYTLRYFDQWLRDDDTGLDDEPPVHVFVMGANQWWAADDWPLPGTEVRAMYLHSRGRANSLKGDGELSWDPPGDQDPDRFDYDPADPVRFGWDLYDGPVDDRLPTIRDDVLVYTSPPMSEALDVVGAVTFELHAASSALDTDWHVRLCDVHPDGSSRFLCHGALRARFRAGWDQPELITPDEPTVYEIDMTATGIRFLPGHRIRIELSSSWAGRFDRNTNTGADNLYRDRGSVIARQTVFHDRSRPTRVLLPTIPAGLVS